jgi:hypothetical protein
VTDDRLEEARREQRRELERASELIAADQHDDPPMSVVIDAPLQHLLGSEENIKYP